MLGHLRGSSHQIFAMKRQKALPVLGGFAILFVGAAVFWWVGRDTGYAVIRPAAIKSDAGQQARRSADAPVPSSKKPAGDALRSPLSSSPAGDAKTAVADTPDAMEPADRTSKLSSEPVSDHPVNVSSGVMAANLLSSPRPSYPALATLMHTRGDVVMLAVISKRGTVKELHVIKGRRLLRGAAKSAVRNWRYRPYRINGVPVDVSTLVRVDFSTHK